MGTDALKRTWEQVVGNVDRYAAGLRADEIRIQKLHHVGAGDTDDTPDPGDEA